MQDFTAGGIHALPNRARSSGDRHIDERIKALVAESGCRASCELIQEMIVTALKMGRDNMDVADLKLFNRALRELRYAVNVFAPYENIPKVVVFGSARTAPEKATFQMAEAFSRAICKRGYMVITGGGGGIMNAAQRGAGREKSFGLNIRLPFEQSANETIIGDSKLVTFNYFFTRKLNFVKESSAAVLFPGGFGTMDEGFEVMTLIQTGKARIMPIICLEERGGTYWETWRSFLTDHLLRRGLISEHDFHLFKITDSEDEAVEEIVTFYKNFHSYRWVREQMVIRLNKPLIATAAASLTARFRDDLLTGEIVATGALPAEANEPEIASLPRLVLTPNRRNYGRLRQLIDAINQTETD